MTIEDSYQFHKEHTMQTVFLRTQFNYNPDTTSELTGLDCSIDPDTGEIVEDRTQQQFKDECDINTIVKRFGLTGELPENYKAPQSGDFTQVTDYQTALNAVLQADEQFMELPAELRARFAHDPQQLLNFLDNNDNRDEAIKLGLVPKPQEKTRDMVQAIDELATKILPITK